MFRNGFKIGGVTLPRSLHACLSEEEQGACLHRTFYFLLLLLVLLVLDNSYNTVTHNERTSCLPIKGPIVTPVPTVLWARVHEYRLSVDSVALGSGEWDMISTRPGRKRG